jgi:hypothetical protein
VLIEGGRQMHGLAVATGMTGTSHRLSVHRYRPPEAPTISCSLVGELQPCIQPGLDSGIQRVSVRRVQDPADGSLIGRIEPPDQRITADAESGQDPAARPRPNSPTAVNERTFSKHRSRAGHQEGRQAAGLRRVP